MPILPRLTSVWIWEEFTGWWLFLLISVTASAGVIQLLLMVVFPSLSATFVSAVVGGVMDGSLTERAKKETHRRITGSITLRECLLSFSKIILYFQ